MYVYVYACVLSENEKKIKIVDSGRVLFGELGEVRSRQGVFVEAL